MITHSAPSLLDRPLLDSDALPRPLTPIPHRKCNWELPGPYTAALPDDGQSESRKTMENYWTRMQLSVAVRGLYSCALVECQAPPSIHPPPMHRKQAPPPSLKSPVDSTS